MRGHHTIVFHEYSGFRKEDGKESTLLSDLGLSPHEEQILQSISIDGRSKNRVFEFSPNTIRARNVVGVILIGDLQIEIHPKLLAKSSSGTTSILQNLMFMLSYAHQLDIEDSGIANLSRDFGSFIEAYIAIFSERLIRLLVKTGIPKRYEDRADNLSVIRGRINFARNSVINVVNRAKVYCEYTEFTEENVISRAFKYVAVGLKKICQSLESQRKLRMCLALLDGVTPAFVEPEVLERATFGRRDPNFSALIQLTKMFLGKLRPQFGRISQNKVFALLFDMNQLFEQFIYEVLRRHSSDLNIDVKAQARKRLVTAERSFLETSDWIDRDLFDTYTDIEVISRKTGAKVILDTKYKIVGTTPHYGIDNSDVYQILAYRQIHASGVEVPNVGLLYPRFESDLRKEFKVNGAGATFFAATVDLSRDFRTSMSELVGELHQLLKAAFSSRDEIGNQVLKRVSND